MNKGNKKTLVCKAVMNARTTILGLYRRVMRVHQSKLDPQMRQIGDSYVRNEFKAMKKSEKEEHYHNFIKGWEDYVTLLLSQPTITGKNLELKERKKLNQDQKDNLKKLRRAAKE
eukprot:TRINITY_DN5755_c0_g1_i1.p1 TRINITY_DN5755_c0_g1~~TRINITY_DN5755_c0_g1_i1.p1  ORF type:complete len:115 (+),score=28.97 TRINITY_DN5755_c0_g1_i1:120-464(+)